jgi:hypothetical protein
MMLKVEEACYSYLTVNISRDSFYRTLLKEKECILASMERWWQEDGVETKWWFDNILQA